ncbi:uncharacterized protein FFNC_15657 [Fusarium fujikuroi]|nr:uncharacterized protein FFNC_15657 [Fusarium fujikuroi]
MFYAFCYRNVLGFNPGDYQTEVIVDITSGKQIKECVRCAGKEVARHDYLSTWRAPSAPPEANQPSWRGQATVIEQHQ